MPTWEVRVYLRAKAVGQERECMARDKHLHTKPTAKDQVSHGVEVKGGVKLPPVKVKVHLQHHLDPSDDAMSIVKG